MLMAQKAVKDEQPKPLKELISKQYHSYLDVFEKKKSEQFPEQCLYDHTINLKPDFQPKDFKLYSLSPIEQEKLNEFLEENLQKGYI